MWNGALVPSTRKSIAEHFDIINIKVDGVIGIAYVTVVFHNSPNKQYVFEIPEDRFESDKESIGEEILRQLQA